jgi:hypothetical protein
MGIRERLARLSGKEPADSEGSTRPRVASAQEALQLAQYTYLLRVAGPEVLEQVHREAFADLSMEQCERMFLRLRQDLPDGRRPESSEPAELARSAVAAHADDHRYLMRMLRRPGPADTDGHFTPQAEDHSGGPLPARSVLGPVAATAATSDAATQSLAGFGNSPEAAQVNASVSTRPAGAARDGGLPGVGAGGGGTGGAGL